MAIRKARGLLALVLVSTACTQAAVPPTRTSQPRLPQPEAPVTAPAASVVTLGLGETAVHAATGLSIALLAIDDRRCPIDVTCVWAGHARVRLRVGLPGEAGREVEIGTAAPANMRLPYDACHAGLRLHLQALSRASAAQPAPRVVVRVSAGCAPDPVLQ